MKQRLLRRGLSVCALVAVILVGAFSYLSLRGGASAHARAHTQLATHPVETLGLAECCYRYHLFSSNAAGGLDGDGNFVYGPQVDSYIYPVAGDWTGKGYDSIGAYDPVAGIFYLRNSNSGGNADIAFPYGPPNSSCHPLAGDWTGKGYDSIGVDCNGVFYLRNSNTPGKADIAFAYGPPTEAGCWPIAGDWTGKGYDSIGVYCFRLGPPNLTYLRNSNSSGYADITFLYGAGGGLPVVGDWIGQGMDTIGEQCGESTGQTTWCLRNSNSAGYADTTFTVPVDIVFPIAGHWTP